MVEIEVGQKWRLKRDYFNSRMEVGDITEVTKIECISGVWRAKVHYSPAPYGSSGFTVSKLFLDSWELVETLKFEVGKFYVQKTNPTLGYRVESVCDKAELSSVVIGHTEERVLSVVWEIDLNEGIMREATEEEANGIRRILKPEFKNGDEVYVTSFGGNLHAVVDGGYNESIDSYPVRPVNGGGTLFVRPDGLVRLGLKLEDLKAGQLVVRKSDGWGRHIKKVSENYDRITYMCGVPGTETEDVGDRYDFLVDFRLPTEDEEAVFKVNHPDYYSTVSVDIKTEIRGIVADMESLVKKIELLEK